MRTLLLILSLAFIYPLTTGCSSTSTTPASTKGKEIVDCMDKGTPEECDRQVNRRRTTY